MELRELVHPWSKRKICHLARDITQHMHVKKGKVFLNFIFITVILQTQRAFPFHDFSPSSFPDFPPTHYEVRSCVWRQWQILGPAFHSTCMQCSHWGHLIRLTSAGAPCTECATQNLGESIIPQLTFPWHLQPPIYFRFVDSFSFSSLFSPTKRSISFLSSQKTLIRAQALSLENSDYHLAL